MISTTTYVTTLPSSTSNSDRIPDSGIRPDSGYQQQQQITPSSKIVTEMPYGKIRPDSGYQQQQTQLPDIDHSPLSLLAEEAARRTPSLNLSPSTTLDVPLDPKFIGGPIIAGSKYKKP